MWKDIKLAKKSPYIRCSHHILSQNITINDLRILESIISLNNDILPRSGQNMDRNISIGSPGKQETGAALLGGWVKVALLTPF